ncbi:MAG: phosphoribosylformylglycinamidine synthase subunit PurQ [Methanomassiliicoccales archaeon]|jgi:phosphoribosylformylglycinamidine synthase|nr:phosphoribosylformylglycinamidine synthase subunit PurQ [Methanomassiliicoccales archaeon]MDD1756075.1 phosphoribosylformylglycinamidine synthase subunit PurQ [Methanomassiliicoccales archaeon]
MSSREVRVCVLRIEGTNCEEETSLAFMKVGASPEKVHLKQLIHSCPEEMRRDLDSYDILALPGGFSAGDYVRAGAIFAARIRSALSKEVEEFVKSGKPVIGICNGFQILVELGMLPAFGPTMNREPQAALYVNDSARFECIPTLLKHENAGNCIFTRNLPKGKVVMFPCAHMEGKLMFRMEEEAGRLAKLEEDGQVVFRYVDPEGRYGGYPWSPNGSISSIAGLCNPAGNVMGLMPHPERVFHRFTHPDWTRMNVDPAGDGDGRTIFQSAVEYASKRKK